jgi:hypothetical protein
LVTLTVLFFSLVRGRVGKDSVQFLTDTGLPRERIAHIVEDAEAQVVVENGPGVALVRQARAKKGKG